MQGEGGPSNLPLVMGALLVAIVFGSSVALQPPATANQTAASDLPVGATYLPIPVPSFDIQKLCLFGCTAPSSGAGVPAGGTSVNGMPWLNSSGGSAAPAATAAQNVQSGAGNNPTGTCLTGKQTKGSLQTKCLPGCVYELDESTSVNDSPGSLTLKVVKAPPSGYPNAVWPPGQVIYKTYLGTMTTTCHGSAGSLAPTLGQTMQNRWLNALPGTGGTASTPVYVQSTPEASIPLSFGDTAPNATLAPVTSESLPPLQATPAQGAAESAFSSTPADVTARALAEGPLRLPPSVIEPPVLKPPAPDLTPDQIIKSILGGGTSQVAPAIQSNLSANTSPAASPIYDRPFYYINPTSPLSGSVPLSEFGGPGQDVSSQGDLAPFGGAGSDVSVAQPISFAPEAGGVSQGVQADLQQTEQALQQARSAIAQSQARSSLPAPGQTPPLSPALPSAAQNQPFSSGKLPVLSLPSIGAPSPSSEPTLSYPTQLTVDTYKGDFTLPPATSPGISGSDALIPPAPYTFEQLGQQLPPIAPPSTPASLLSEGVSPPPVPAPSASTNPFQLLVSELGNLFKPFFSPPNSSI